MALPKLAQFAVILSVICYTLDKSGFNPLVFTFFEESVDSKSPSLYAREKRETAITSTEYELDVIMSFSDSAILQMITDFNVSISIDNKSEISSLVITTVCSLEKAGYQCKCEENFAWSYNTCLTYGACDAITGDTCGCINDLPADGQSCQFNGNQIVERDVLNNLFIPVASVPPNLLDSIIAILKNESFPVTILSLEVREMNLSTVCDPSSAQGLRCKCEDDFSWPCEMCTSNTTCSSDSSSSCNCIYKSSFSEQYCQPVTEIHQCPVRSTTTPTLSTQNVTTVATTETFTVTESFTLNMQFKESYNDPDSDLYKNVSAAAEINCKAFVSTDCKVQNLKFRSGSTIADFSLSSSSQDVSKVQLAKDEMLNQLVENYPVEIVSPKKLDVTDVVSSEEIIAGDSVTLTCGPPPTNLGLNLRVVWTFAGTVLEPTKGSDEGTSKYTIPQFFQIHDGKYVCTMSRKDGAIFTQSRDLKSKPAPVITVNPISAVLKCPGSQTLKCSVEGDYKVEFRRVGPIGPGTDISYKYTASSGCQQEEKEIICQVTGKPETNKIIKLALRQNVYCEGDKVFGAGYQNFVAVASCEDGMVGNRTAVCKADRTYGDFQDNCVLEVIQNLLDQSATLDKATMPGFLENLKDATINNTETITDSPATINAMVDILENVANRSGSLNITIYEESTKNIMKSAGVLTIDTAKKSWDTLNNETSNKVDASSSFLSAFEGITANVVNKPLNINTDHIIFTKTNFTNIFKEDFNSSVEVEIAEAEVEKQSISVIVFASMNNVLPVREKTNTSSSVINGRVALIQPESNLTNISIAFDVLNETLGNPKCVFWDFDLFDGLGGWSEDGCSFVMSENGSVTCNCDHTTSFSILMSPSSYSDPPLEYITYIGVGISMGSLIICLIIEGIVWRKIRTNRTSYLRHVSIVNIAVSLLIADIWFIIGAAISKTKNAPACTAATFFIHFFYLAMFFWMLASALLLLYLTVNVFDGGLSKASMLAIGFSLGYGAPLIIATITIAVTAPSKEYIQNNNACWLNWYKSKALLGFVIPALLIVAVNLIILIVVIFKIVWRRYGENAAQAGEKHVLLVIARSLAVLTPFFGITWGLGVGIMASPKNRGIHITFALFNSLQGLFILVFGTLLDRMVWTEIRQSHSSTSQIQTGSSGARNISSGVGDFFRRFRRERRSRSGYQLSSNGATNLSFNT
ncbi:PREDICTED: adhesion G protein-coupled receptor F5-like [Cyprinodon variegatus]|uniref:adhesion G protein-coupled receptor F5-like n=1 Tax=Cyprinodon variegatus TaxID=28743 RepID=UPI000742630D|nr:PREDICTED: adhesion G protein-coupled receptor F5-like [Cyprinodon variegatus]